MLCEVILSLFALNGFYPQSSEILFCTRKLSLHELESFILRACYSNSVFKRRKVFVIANF
jgi:hypothetical protein